jgi:hypothetical protein
VTEIRVKAISQLAVMIASMVMGLIAKLTDPNEVSGAKVLIFVILNLQARGKFLKRRRKNPSVGF